MLDLTSLEIFGRRDFLKNATVAGMLPFGIGGGPSDIPDCPLQRRV